MSGFAMFSRKDQSLLAFDERRCDELESLHGVLRVRVIPCDSHQMRTTLDGVTPDSLRLSFRTLFNCAQGDKALEKLVWLDGHYLLALDGTGKRRIMERLEIHSIAALTKFAIRQSLTSVDD